MIHKEGFLTLILTIFGVTIMVALVGYFYTPGIWWAFLLGLVLLGLFLQFFRNPKRTIPKMDDQLLYAPADGKVVVIEETTETEYFQDKRIQVSIFMSPFNVHVNRIPISGIVSYFKYHPGKYLVAWHPKSSTENERTTMVLENPFGKVLIRQIAGALARRIKWYVKEGQSVTQGQEYGFIKFGSRVDLYLPIGTEILVTPNQVVSGNKSAIARFKDKI
jgi:phosphatidylserine decarboxylase